MSRKKQLGDIILCNITLRDRSFKFITGKRTLVS